MSVLSDSTGSVREVIHVAVGSKNPVKLNAAKSGIEKALSGQNIVAHALNAPSNVPDQPIGDAQTKEGAINRARNCFNIYRDCNEGREPDFAVGLEGGVLYATDDYTSADMECFAWIAVYDGKKLGTARTSSFALPPIMKQLVLRDGLELGDADDTVFGTVNSKQAGGTVGKLTNGVIDRAAYYEQAVILAMIPFQWPDLYPN